MSVRMLTLCDLGTAAIKLLGVTYLAQTIAGLLALLAMFFVPAQAGLPGVSEMLPAQLMGTLGWPVAAIALIGWGAQRAARLFPATPLGSSISRSARVRVTLARCCAPTR